MGEYDMLMTLTEEFEVGDKVLYSGAWGRDDPLETTITGKDFCDLKGEMVYDNDLGRWGYDFQYARDSS